jgi:alpha-D-xyloside xylohydrolase
MARHYAWVASFLAMAMLPQSGMADPLPLRAIEKDGKGLSVKLDPGTLRLEVCSDRIIRVSYSPTEIIPTRQEFSVVKRWADAPFTVGEDDRAVTVSTPQMSVRVDRTTGALAFADASGRVFLQESPTGGKKMTPAMINGESTFAVEQSFVSPADELLLGMSQSQDGIWNWRGIPIELRQQNTQTAIPVMISSKGYGLLWNNASLTDFNPADNEIPLKPQDPSAKYDGGGPTATEQIKGAAAKRGSGLAAHTGTFTSDAAGRLRFLREERRPKAGADH